GRTRNVRQRVASGLFFFRLRLGWRRFGLLAQLAIEALGRLPIGPRDTLLLHRFRSLLGRLLDLTGHFGAGLLLEVLPRRVAVKDLLALRVEIDAGLGVERLERTLLAQRPAAGANTALVRLVRVVGLALHALAGTLAGLLQARQLIAERFQVLVVQ